MPKVLKKNYLTAVLDLALDANEISYVRLDAFRHLFEVNAEGGKKGGKLVPYSPPLQAQDHKNLPLSTIKDMVGLAYTVILKKLGRNDPGTLNILKTAINHLSDHELKLEWESICDGTVSNIAETMMNFGDQSNEVQQDIVNLFEGLAVPYFKQYKGKVPAEDLEWAHKEVRDYFQNLKDRKSLEKQEPAKSLPGARKALKGNVDPKAKFVCICPECEHENQIEDADNEEEMYCEDCEHCLDPDDCIDIKKYKWREKN